MTRRPKSCGAWFELRPLPNPHPEERGTRVSKDAARLVASPFETAAARPPQGEEHRAGTAIRETGFAPPYRLFDLDAGVLDDLAPAFFLPTEIPVERVGRLATMTRPSFARAQTFRLGVQPILIRFYFFGVVSAIVSTSKIFWSPGNELAGMHLDQLCHQLSRRLGEQINGPRQITWRAVTAANIARCRALVRPVVNCRLCFLPLLREALPLTAADRPLRLKSASIR